MEDEAARWMRVLDERHDEVVATLDRERMALELVFRIAGPDGIELAWITMQGDGGASVETSEHEIDVVHRAFDARVREPGWTRGRLELALMPSEVRAAIEAWLGRESAQPTDSAQSAQRP